MLLQINANTPVLASTVWESAIRLTASLWTRFKSSSRLQQPLSSHKCFAMEPFQELITLSARSYTSDTPSVLLKHMLWLACIPISQMVSSWPDSLWMNHLSTHSLMAGTSNKPIATSRCDLVTSLEPKLRMFSQCMQNLWPHSSSPLT